MKTTLTPELAIAYADLLDCVKKYAIAKTNFDEAHLRLSNAAEKVHRLESEAKVARRAKRSGRHRKDKQSA